MLRTIFTITHLEHNKPEVCLAKKGVFSIYSEKIWKEFNVNVIAPGYQKVLVFPQQSAPSRWTQRFLLTPTTVKQMGLWFLCMLSAFSSVFLCFLLAYVCSNKVDSGPEVKYVTVL